MHRFVFQYSGNPLVRILIGLASLALFAGLAFLMLPVVLAIIAAAIVMGLIAWGWAWYQSKKMGNEAPWTEQFQETLRQRQYSSQQSEYASRTTRQTEQTVVRIETSDKKKWKMDDVEDIEAKH
ncbi:MAG: hypothetical protein KHX35_01260 [Sutterella wadsworthensis]|jgi:hypothetical protein|nr:hypothetical protein [Sutterella wadsworthensis]